MLKKALFVVVALGVAGQAQAQSFGAEVRGGLAMPTGEWNDDDGVESGWGVGVNGHAMFTPMLGVYAGWDRWSFGLEGDEDLNGVDASVNDSGFRGGLHVALPLQNIPAGPYVRGGVFYGKTQFDFSEGGESLELESESAVGFEVEGGVEIPLGPTLSFTPAVMYRQHDADFGIGGETTVGYVGFSMGLRYNLGTR